MDSPECPFQALQSLLAIAKEQGLSYGYDLDFAKQLLAWGEVDFCSIYECNPAKQWEAGASVYADSYVKKEHLLSDGLPFYQWVQEAQLLVVRGGSLPLYLGDDVAAAEVLLLPVSLQTEVFQVLLLGSIAEGVMDEAWCQRMQTLGVLLEQIVDLNHTNVALRQSKDIADYANQAKTAFLSEMSHEIRTPLNAILGMLEVLNLTTLEKEQQHYATVAHSNAENLLDIINEILDFSKIQAGEIKINAQPSSVVEILEDTIVSMAQRAEAEGLSLIVENNQDIPAPLLFDGKRLRQVLVNLIGNALKFTEHGCVWVRVTEVSYLEEGAVRVDFSVEDTGIGISEEKLGVIFEPFKQESESTSHTYGGTGLGLSICKKLVELMSGAIRVESEAGQGSEFLFHIVCQQDKNTVVGQATRGGLAGMHAVVLDRFVHSAEALRCKLSSYHMVVSTLDTDVSCVGLLTEKMRESNTPRFIFVDYILLKTRGALVELLEDISVKYHAVIFVSTTLSQESELRQERYAFAYVVLRSPLLPSRLYDTLIQSMLPPTVVHSASESQGPPSTDVESVDTMPLPTLRILVAEDIDPNRQLFVLQFKKLGYAIDLAEDGEEALSRLAKQEYDVLFLDLQMPKKMGIEVVTALRADSLYAQNKDLYVVALTANVMTEERERCLAAGMNDFVTKPVNMASLRASVQRYYAYVKKQEQLEIQLEQTEIDLK